MFWNKKNNKMSLDFLVEGESVIVKADWPDISNMTQDQITYLIQTYSSLVCLLSEGILLNIIQEAIVLTGVRKKEINISRAISNNINNYILGKDGSDDEDLVVPPSKAFDVRGNNDHKG